ncbi:M48 family metalloprotease [Parvibaculum sp.]|uniref:M48 family metalloprotease n=1 Tax=Parvibaculum sp. TaxID=2024848 RepID=UPI002734E8F9|nr:M48 family metalloprotease [Parvibaculum sp.]MDP3328644.1 M48 family metalloprotease [Parvibaculum sp.]
MKSRAVRQIRQSLKAGAFGGIRYLGLVLLAAGAVALSACTTNPATGKSQIAPLMSPEQEARAGAEAHPKILEVYGGAYDDAKVGGYVAGVTTRIARATNQPNGPYRVTVLDSPVVNAFALPGGYVYVTRGLMALVNDEAELASVIGHEIGHVAARHSAQRQTAAIGTSLLGAVLGAVVGSNAVNQAFGLGGQGFLASYSRDQEYEADMLGVQYLAKAGYDPYAAADFLNSMGAQEALNAKVRNAEHDASRNDWLASHPATPARVSAANAHARETGAAPGQQERNRDAYLSAIDGMLYGDDPDEGIVRDREFIHPKLGFSFKAPPGFTLTNSATAVVAQGPDGTIAKFDTGQNAGGVEIGQYLANEWAKGVRLASLERFTVNGMKAATATATIGNYNGRLVAIEFGPGRVYRFLMGTVPQAGTRHDAALQELVMSFRKISAAEARAVKPLRIRIVTVRPGDTALSLGRRMIYSDFQAERFRVLNGLAGNGEPRPGTRAKIIAE